MDAFVLDASVALTWCFPHDPTETTPYSRAILQYVEETDVVVPEIWAFEIANGTFVAHNKRRRITRIDVDNFIQLLGALPVRVVRRAWTGNVALEELARKHDLAAYDFVYLDLAIREK